MIDDERDYWTPLETSGPRRWHPAKQVVVWFLGVFVGILIAAWVGHAWPW